MPKTSCVYKSSYEATGVIRAKCKHHGNHHYCLCKDDRHYPCRIHFQRQVLTHSSVLLITYYAFGVLYGYFACALYQQHGKADNYHEYNHFEQEHYRTSCSVFVHFHDKFLSYRLWQTCYDTYHNEHRDTVTYTFVGHSFTEPHYEHRSGTEYYYRGEREAPKAIEVFGYTAHSLTYLYF